MDASPSVADFCPVRQEPPLLYCPTTSPAFPSGCICSHCVRKSCLRNQRCAENWWLKSLKSSPSNQLITWTSHEGITDAAKKYISFYWETSAGIECSTGLGPRMVNGAIPFKARHTASLEITAEKPLLGDYPGFSLWMSPMTHSWDIGSISFKSV